jgi:hypothetical protein
MHVLKKLPLIFFLAVLLFHAPAARATGSLRELEPLTFGRVAVTGAPPLRIVVAPTGAETTPDGGVTLLSPRGSSGLYELTGYAPSVSLWITIADTTVAGSGANGALDLTDFNFSPACTMATPCATDGAGELMVKIGATLTTAAGQTYGPGPYRGTYNLLLNF